MAGHTLERRNVPAALVAGARWLLNPVSVGGAKQVPRMKLFAGGPALARLAEGQTIEGTTRVPGIPGRMGVLASAGEIVTTGDDMALFLGALIGARSTPLDAAIALATTPLAAGPDGRDMGYAIEIEHRADGDVLRKGGNTSSYSAYVMWSRSPATGVAVMTSCGSFMAVVELAEELHDGARALAR